MLALRLESTAFWRASETGALLVGRLLQDQAQRYCCDTEATGGANLQLWREIDQNTLVDAAEPVLMGFSCASAFPSKGPERSPTHAIWYLEAVQGILPASIFAHFYGAGPASRAQPYTLVVHARYAYNVALDALSPLCAAPAFQACTQHLFRSSPLGPAVSLARDAVVAAEKA